MTINELHAKAHAGDEFAKKQLFEKLSVRLRLIANQRIWSQVDSEDVVQDAMMTIAKEFRDLEVTTSFTAWAVKVLDNKVLSYIKSQRTQTKYFDKGVVLETESSVTPSTPFLKDSLKKCLKEISSHNSNYSRVVNFQYQGYTIDEICKRMGITKNHSYVLLSRARSMLKACLKKAGVL